MPNWLISLFFALGAGGFAYSKLGRRVGYGNTQNVWIIIAVVFVVVFLFFFTLFRYVL